jgi:hypothetical protein
MIVKEFKFLDDYEETIAQRTQASFISDIDF